MSDFTGLVEATRRLVRTVDGLDAEALAEPSVLPGWTRAHVVAHLTLNAESLTGVLDGIARNEPVAMYASDDARDQDIEQLAGEDAPELRERFLGSLQPFEAALSTVPEDAWAGDFPRVPDGLVFRRDRIPTMRHREVEIHHADLATDYTPADWPAPFAIALVRTLAADRSGHGPFTVTATDVDLSVTVGEGQIETDNGLLLVTGPVGALGWWLAGRGSGEGLSVGGGTLPELGVWR